MSNVRKHKNREESGKNIKQDFQTAYDLFIGRVPDKTTKKSQKNERESLHQQIKRTKKIIIKRTIAEDNPKSTLQAPIKRPSDSDIFHPQGDFLLNSITKRPDDKRIINHPSLGIIKRTDGGQISITDKRGKTHTYDGLFEFIRNFSSKIEMDTLLNILSWQDFEIFIKEALEQFGYRSIRTFRFKSASKRFEVDVIARRNLDLLFIDAKRWSFRTANNSALLKASKDQLKRAQYLASEAEILRDLLIRLGLKNNLTDDKFLRIKIYPIILISSTISSHIINGIPIIPILKFNQFLLDFMGLKGDYKFISPKQTGNQKRLSNFL